MTLARATQQQSVQMILVRGPNHPPVTIMKWISCFQVQQWSYTTIWVSLTQCTSQGRRRGILKLSHEAKSEKKGQGRFPFLCSTKCPQIQYVSLNVL